MVLCVVTRLNAEFKLFTDTTIIRTQKKENPSQLLLFTLGYKTPINKNRIIN